MAHAASVDGPAGYRLGDAIAVEDLLALPPDGRRYARDDQGRLVLMAPDDGGAHGYPLARLARHLHLSLGRGWETLQEPAIAFEPIHALGGRRLPPSRLGRRALEPDLAVFGGRPRLLPRTPGGARLFAPHGLALVVEVLSPCTWRSDLGCGEADAVDRWRTYLASGVPEYWLLNAWTVEAGLPPRSALFLRSDGQAWRPLAVDGGEPAAEGAGPHGLTPLHAGRVRSQAVAGLSLDLAGLWSELDLESEVG